MIHVGTSGWQYDDWRGDFYPRELPKKDWLVYFSERFPLVEVNNTFYNLPAEETFVRWRTTAADDFLFVVKASRYITHIRRLRECEEAIWNDPEVNAALDRAGCAVELADRPARRIDDVVTGGWSYVRFHQGTPLASGYLRSKLRRWADRLVALPAEETFVFFNNDPGGAAVRDARTLTELLAERGARVRGPRE